MTVDLLPPLIDLKLKEIDIEADAAAGAALCLFTDCPNPVEIIPSSNAAIAETILKVEPGAVSC